MTNVKIPWLVTNVILWRRTTYGTIRLSRCAAGKNNWFAWNLDGKSVSLCQWKTFLFCSSRQLPLLRAFWADALFNDHRLASCVAPEFQRIKDTVSCNVLGGGPRTLSRTTYRVTRRVFLKSLTSKLHLLFKKNLAGYLKTLKVTRISPMYTNFLHPPVHSGPSKFSRSKI